MCLLSAIVITCVNLFYVSLRCCLQIFETQNEADKNLSKCCYDKLKTIKRRHERTVSVSEGMYNLFFFNYS